MKNIRHDDNWKYRCVNGYQSGIVVVVVVVTKMGIERGVEMANIYRVKICAQGGG